MQTDIAKLVFAVTAAFVLPALAYLIGVIWNKAVNKTFGLSNENEGMSKSWTTVYLVMPLVILGMMVLSHFDVIRIVWLRSPVIATLAYAFLGILVPIGIMYSIIRLWRPVRRHPR